MTLETEKQEIKDMIVLVNDEEIKFKVDRALECMEDPPRHPIVTNAIARARKSGYAELALKLASLAYELNPDNPYFLVELCTNLSFMGRSNDIINKINEFLEKKNAESLPNIHRDAIMVTYAAALKGIGRYKEGIDVLEKLSSDRRNVLELLAEIYYINSEPQKTIKLLQSIDPLSSKMVSLQKKALDSTRITTIKNNHDPTAILAASIKEIKDENIRTIADSALQALGNSSLSDQSQSRIVTRSIHDIRRAEGGAYRNLAFEIASLAYKIDPNNPYYLGELSILLIVKGENQTAIYKIADFMNRIENNCISISNKNKEYLNINLAHAYSGIGKISQGIKILEGLNSEAPNVIEGLSELYCKNEEPNKTVELLKDRKLTEKMAYWLAKSYQNLSQQEEALKIIETFSDRNIFKNLKVDALARQQIAATKPEEKSKRIWVIHGRNDKLAHDVFNFLRAIGLDPVEWEEARKLTGVSSPYIGDVLKAAFDYAQAFIVLLTGDDEAKLSDRYIKPGDFEYERNPTPQARQNVIFEAGMAFGRDPNKVVFVQHGKIRPFSSISGILILQLDNSPRSRKEFVIRLRDAKCEIADLETKSDWLEVGDFRDQE